ncbi:MAG TPA: zf-HC2 domain-containing protein [Candidatus Acidoferrales bacterium]
MPAQETKAELEQLTCTEVMHALPDFLNGRITAEKAQHIRWHLNHCPECGYVVRRARETLKDILATAGRKIRESNAA